MTVDFDAAALALGFRKLPNGKWYSPTPSPSMSTGGTWATAEDIFDWWGRSNASPAGGESVAIVGEQEPVAWQWHVGENCWTACEPPSDDELRQQPHKFRPLYLGRMPALTCHGPHNIGEGDPTVTPDCIGAGTSSNREKVALAIQRVSEQRQRYAMKWQDALAMADAVLDLATPPAAAQSNGDDLAKLADELTADYPAVDVTAVGFSKDFAGVGCCVIPQDRVLAIIAALRTASEGPRS